MATARLLESAFGSRRMAATRFTTLPEWQGGGMGSGSDVSGTPRRIVVTGVFHVIDGRCAGFDDREQAGHGFHTGPRRYVFVVSEVDDLLLNGCCY